jgi:pyruvate/2-oxoglutarate/acetoin dehydrogenase E1 component
LSGEYALELRRAMKILTDDPRTYFVGQAVEHPGTAMFATLEDVPPGKRREMPVAEDFQLGYSIGRSIYDGTIPICIYPRWNFLGLAFSQLVHHLDKLPEYGNGYAPKVIIRTAVATAEPLDPGPQHLGNYSRAFRHLLRNISVIELMRTEHIVPFYQQALAQPDSSILVEYTEFYDA